MPHLFWHQRLSALAHEIIDVQLEGLKISPAIAAYTRLHLVKIERLVQSAELTATELVGLTDATDAIFRALFDNSGMMTEGQKQALEEVYEHITGLPVTNPAQPVLIEQFFAQSFDPSSPPSAVAADTAVDGAG